MTFTEITFQDKVILKAVIVLHLMDRMPVSLNVSAASGSGSLWASTDIEQLIQHGVKGMDMHLYPHKSIGCNYPSIP